MSNHSGTTRICYAEGAARETALRFISEQYALQFGTTPADEPDHLFVALQEEMVVGTIGINVARADRDLRLGKLYRFDPVRAPLPVCPEETIEYGRWIALAGGISSALLYRATSFALGVGKKYGWCEHSDRVHRICTRMGLPFYKVDSELDLANVAEADGEFYRRNPDVKLYMVKLAEWESVLAKSVRQREDIVL